MLYAILIYQAEGAQDHFTPAEMEAVLAEHRSLQEDTKRAEAFFGAIQLTEGSAAATIRKKGAQVTVQDGPFAETKELLVGFYLLECDDLQQAIEYGSRIPHAEFGAVEVRPVVYFADRGGVVKP